uniref:GPI inositol-deacylase n=1 Tax=Anthurium amnicola TaxID=1678845 RepID=A0A1D1YR07_9ARAE
MQGCRARCRLAAVVVFSLWLGLSALYGLLKPAPNGCTMTYMYPTYVPIATDANVSSGKYGMFLYHEGWKKIDFNEHLKNLDGVPVLFIPGNGGSYKQVRSLAAESSRAFQGGSLEPSYYKEASLAFSGERSNLVMEDPDEFSFSFPNQYNRKLDWFAVDLEEEHSAMDGRILEEHTEYVVYAIHRILDQYEESKEARSKEGAEVLGSLPTSVILVGHSMGGFVARAAIIHPQLRKSSVETVLTLSSPHQSPPIALQPSLGHLFSHVNSEWRKGYEIQTTHAGRFSSGPKMSHVVVISIAGGVYDYQVRSKLASLEGIVPATNGFMISSSSMKNVWLSMDHQSILWCNQLVVQISHTLLTIINPDTGRPFSSTQKRLAIFTRMLQSGVSQSYNWMGDVQATPISTHVPIKDAWDATGSQLPGFTSCPSSVHWPDDSLEKDLYIQSRTITVLAMDGRRRWLDIHKLGSNGRDHFVLVTNLAPCSGIRLHLWPKKNRTSEVQVSMSKSIVEVTSKMVHIPAGPAPRQIEPGSQTEQAPPSAVIQLSPGDMHGFRFLTISVAPRPTVSGRPPPAASMAVGQFFNPKEGEVKLSPMILLRTFYNEEDIFVNEDHPLPIRLLFSISLGLLPVTLSVRTVDCGIKSSTFPNEQAGDAEHSSLCKLRCFPPVALAWDSTLGVHVVPNLYSDTIQVDSSPASWGSSPESEKTILLLLVDPHCTYKLSASVSLSAAASRFTLLYSSQIIGFMTAVIFFALMRQAHAWELDLPLPSILMAIELNLRMPLPFLLLAVIPIIVFLFLSLLTAQSLPSVANFITVSIVCYVIANGCVIILALSSLFIFYFAASIHIFIKQRWQAWEENYLIIFIRRLFNFSSIFYSFKVVRILKGNPNVVLAFVTIPLVIFVHPALGLILLLLFHAYHCHDALCSQRKEMLDSRNNGAKTSSGDTFDHLLPLDEMCSNNSPSSGKSYADIQLELFNYRHGLLILHLLSVLMFVPSLVARLQRIRLSQSFPQFLDSALCVGVILHGLCGLKPDVSALKFPLPGIPYWDIGLNLLYLLSGYYSYLYALAAAPFRTIYAMAALGVVSCAARVIDQRNRDKSDANFGKIRKHSHKH